MLDIIFRDKYLVAINKPGGLLAHRTHIAEEKTEFALEKLESQLNHKLYLLHRIDRPTSGILLFAYKKEIASAIGKQFQDQLIKKQYIALVRGWITDPINLNHPVKNEEKTKSIEARTDFIPLKQIELPYPVRPYNTARYTMVICHPHNGRWHQIRQHLAHLRHYIVNDRVHGDGHHNRLFTEKLNIPYMFLHAHKMEFIHPVSGAKIHIEAPFPSHWLQFLQPSLTTNL